MWLKSYFNLKDDRAIWGKIADAILAGPKATPRIERNFDPNVKINYFAQSWETKTRALPETLKRMIKTAKTIGLRLEGRNLSRETRRNRPIWYHTEANDRIRSSSFNHTGTIKCLRENHKIQTVGQTEDLASMSTKETHIPWNECECPDCVEIAELTGCDHPHDCYTKATELLNLLDSKWDPRASSTEDDEEDPAVYADGWKEFDARMTTFGPISETARIFTE
ncbi:hypothetical protein F5876DRAFT_53078, partial [Lentinula aff. lateritia]